MTLFDASVIAAALGLGLLVGIVVGMVIGSVIERHRDWYGNVRGDGERWDGIDDSMKVPREWL